MSRHLSFFCALVILATVIAASLISAAVPLEIFRRHHQQQQHRHNKVDLRGTPVSMWTADVSAPLFTTPFLQGGQNLIVGGADGKLVNYNRFNGQANWTFTAPSNDGKKNDNPAINIYSKPALAASGQAVFVATSQGGLYNVDLASGSLDYSFNCNNESIVTTPLVFGTNNVIVATYTGTIFSFSLAGNGAQAWNYSVGDFVSADPVLIPNVSVNGTTTSLVVVPAQDGIIYALDAATGKVVWRTPTSGNRAVASTCAVDSNQKIYCVVLGGQVFKLNSTNGSFDWNVRVPGSPSAAPVLSADGSKIYFPADFTKFYALNTASGSVAWTYDNKNNYLQLPAAVNPVDGTVVFGTNSYTPATVVAVDGNTGAEVYTLSVGQSNNGQVSAGVAVDALGIYFTTSDGTVYAFKN